VIGCVPVFVTEIVNSITSPMFGFAFDPCVTLNQSFTVAYVAPATSAVAEALVCVYIAPVIVWPHTLVHVTSARFVIIDPHAVAALARGAYSTTAVKTAAAASVARLDVITRVFI